MTAHQTTLSQSNVPQRQRGRRLHVGNMGVNNVQLMLIKMFYVEGNVFWLEPKNISVTFVSLQENSTGRL